MKNFLKKQSLKIVFVVDNIYRDYKSLRLIGNFLELQGLRVEFWPTNVARYAWVFFSNGIIINNKPIGHDFNKSYLEKRNVRLGFINTEGASVQFLHESAANFHFGFFWNEKTVADFQKITGCRKMNNYVEGCPRMDFLYSQISHKNSKQKGKIKIIFFSSGGYLDRNNDEIEKVQHMMGAFNRLNDYDINVNKYVALNGVGRTKMLDLINYLIDDEQYSIYIKPHPNEREEFWEEISLSLGKIQIIQGPIENTLKGMDIAISLASCASTKDAMFANVLSITLKVPELEKMYEPEWTSHSIYTFEDVNACIEFFSEIKNYSDIEALKKNKNYKKNKDSMEKKYFYRVDGARCFSHARVIKEESQKLYSAGNYFRLSFEKKNIIAYIRALLSLYRNILDKLTGGKKKHQKNYNENHAELKRLNEEVRSLQKHIVSDKIRD